jgi:predicted unusual protein kinase regulating ubiquinone biosynthesis (AarF/ABC1/UbiB family)
MKTKIEDVFSEIDQTPIASASLAQVHRGVLRENGQEVAVKI